MMMSGWNMQKFQKNFADILYIVKDLNIAKHCVNGNIYLHFTINHMIFSGLSQSNQRNRQTQSPRQMSPRPPLIPSRSRDTNSRSRDSPNMSREQIIGESRSKFHM